MSLLFWVSWENSFLLFIPASAGLSAKTMSEKSEEDMPALLPFKEEAITLMSFSLFDWEDVSCDWLAKAIWLLESRLFIFSNSRVWDMDLALMLFIWFIWSDPCWNPRLSPSEAARTSLSF